MRRRSFLAACIATVFAPLLKLTKPAELGETLVLTVYGETEMEMEFEIDVPRGHGHIHGIDWWLHEEDAETGKVLRSEMAIRDLGVFPMRRVK